MCDNAQVCDDTLVCGNAQVCDDALVYGRAEVSDKALVYSNAMVFGDARVSGNAKVLGDAKVYGDVIVDGCAQVCASAEISRMSDYIVFKNSFSSGRHFTWTRSDNMWTVGCFRGTGAELIEKARQDSEEKARLYALYVKLVEDIKSVTEASSPEDKEHG